MSKRAFRHSCQELRSEVVTDKEIRHKLSGKVKHQGVPIVGAAVRIYPAIPPNMPGVRGSVRQIHTAPSSRSEETALLEMNTSRTGEFHFSLRPGDYRLEVEPRGNGRLLTKRVPKIEVRGNTTCSVSISTGKLLEGVVRLSTGQTVKDCRISAEEDSALGVSNGSPYKVMARTDDTGAFSLVLPAGSFNLNVEYDYANALSRQGADLREKDALRVSSRSASEPVRAVSRREEPAPRSTPFLTRFSKTVEISSDLRSDLILPHLVNLSGEIRDAAGDPAEGMMVRVEGAKEAKDPLSAAPRAVLKCDDNGRFSILVEPGTYSVEIQPASGRGSGAVFGIKDDALEVLKDTSRRYVLREGHKVHGKVVFEGKPVTDCMVRLTERASGQGSERDAIAKTDAQGKFSLSLPDGTYKMVVASPPPAIEEKESGSAKPVLAPWTRTIVVGGETAVDVRMSRGVQIRGRVIDEEDSPRRGIGLSFYPDSTDDRKGKPEPEVNGSAEQAPPAGRIYTDDSGRYTVILAPGTYWAVVHEDWKSPRKIEVETDGDEVDISWTGWCETLFEVTGQEGESIGGCRVSYSPYGVQTEGEETDPTRTGEESTDKEGRCRLMLPRGVYTFEIEPPESSPYRERSIRQLSVGGDMVRKVTLSTRED